MSHQPNWTSLLLIGGLLLCGGCDARDGTLYQSLGALNGGPGAEGVVEVHDLDGPAAEPSNQVEVRAIGGPTVEPSNQVDVRDLTELQADPTPAPRPGGLTVRFASDGPASGLPPQTALVRLEVSAPDLSEALVSLISYPASQSALASFSVPLGSDRTLTVSAKDAQGKVLARGGQQGLTVAAGQYGVVEVAVSTRLGDLFGQVQHGTTLAPEPGVTVTLGDTQALTDQHGVYRLEGLALGEQVIVLNKAGFARATRSIDVKEGPQTAPETLRLSPL